MENKRRMQAETEAVPKRSRASRWPVRVVVERTTCQAGRRRLISCTRPLMASTSPTDTAWIQMRGRSSEEDWMAGPKKRSPEPSRNLLRVSNKYSHQGLPASSSRRSATL